MWARMEVVVDRQAGQSHGGWSHVRSENTDDTRSHRLPGMVFPELVGLRLFKVKYKKSLLTLILYLIMWYSFVIIWCIYLYMAIN